MLEIEYRVYCKVEGKNADKNTTDSRYDSGFPVAAMLGNCRKNKYMYLKEESIQKCERMWKEEKRTVRRQFECSGCTR